MTFFESSSRFRLLLEHDLFRKPVPTPHQVRGRLFRDHALMTGREGLRRWARRASRAWRGLGARVRPIEPIPYAAVEASGPADPIPSIIAAPEFAAATRWFAQEPGRSQLSPEAQALLFTLTRNLKPAH